SGNLLKNKYTDLSRACVKSSLILMARMVNSAAYRVMKYILLFFNTVLLIITYLSQVYHLSSICFSRSSPAANNLLLSLPSDPIKSAGEHRSPEALNRLSHQTALLLLTIFL